MNEPVDPLANFNAMIKEEPSYSLETIDDAHLLIIKEESEAKLDINESQPDYTDENDKPNPSRSSIINNDETPAKRAKKKHIESKIANEDVTINEDIDDENVDTSQNSDDDVEIVSSSEQEEHTTIHLPNYRRSINTSSKCFFPGCKDSKSARHRIAKEVQELMLIKFNYYIPEHARVCLEHMSGDGWDALYKNSELNVFTAEHIEHMLYLAT